MEIIGLTSLTQNQTEQILKLQQACITYDGAGRDLFLSNDINYRKDMPCFYLNYINKKLCGVLVVFAPTMETAEISAYVHPDFRRSGVFSELLLKAWEVLHQFNITQVLIVTDAASSICKEILTKWEANLSHSEYLLVYKGGEQEAKFPYANKCIVREAAESDFEKMVALNMSNFGENYENAAHMVRQNLNHEHTNCFVGQIEEEIFGLANVRKEGSDFYICGLSIDPAHQRRGMGRYLLYKILERLTPADDEEITLEVDSNNQSAYQLYTTSGFVVLSQADYYLLSLPLF